MQVAAQVGEAQTEPFKVSKMERFAKIVNHF